jgi:hypothetical protein
MVAKNSLLVYKYIPYPEFFAKSMTYATPPRIDRNKKPQKLLDQLRDAIRARHYSIRAEKCYADWVRRFVLFHNKRHPREMGAPEVEAFLTHLAVDRNVAASTQNQALAAKFLSSKEKTAKKTS